MRAVLIATGEGPGVMPLDERYPVPLLPLVDRPFLQHVVEFLAAQGVSRYDFILSHLPEKIEHFLGDGTRWGCRFTYHLARDPARPYRLLHLVKFDGGDQVLLGHADRLPLLPLRELAAEHTPLLFGWHNPATIAAEQLQWTGWAVATPEQLLSGPSDADEKDFEDHLRAAGAAWHEAGTLLSMQSFRGILTAHRAVLDREFTGLLLGGREVEPGVWLSRNVVLHPTARVTPPIYIDEDCQVGAGTHLGPFAVIGEGCILDERCTVTDAVIFPGGYVGEGLELAGVLVDKNRLMSADLGGATVVDNFLLGSLSEKQATLWAMRQAGRLAALLLLLLAAPLLLVLAVCLKATRRGPVLAGREVVRLPAPAEERGWQTYTLGSFATDEPPPPATLRDFLLRFLPGLLHVVRGDLGFVGVPPRTPEEIRALVPDWRALYLRAKAGLVTEAMVRHGAGATEDEQYAADGFYAVAAGWGHDVRLLSTYLAHAGLGFLRSAGQEEEVALPTEDEVSV